MNENCIWHRECDCPPEDTIESLRAEVERLKDIIRAVEMPIEAKVVRFQPHPGAGLLAELAALRKVAEALTGHDHGHLSRWVTTLKQSDGEGWAIGEMVQRYLDAIHRKDDR